MSADSRREPGFDPSDQYDTFMPEQEFDKCVSFDRPDGTDTTMEERLRILPIDDFVREGKNSVLVQKLNQAVESNQITP